MSTIRSAKKLQIENRTSNANATRYWHLAFRQRALDRSRTPVWAKKKGNDNLLCSQLAVPVWPLAAMPVMPEVAEAF